MRKLLIIVACCVAAVITQAGEKYTVQVLSSDISNGYVVKKIWLQQYAKPILQLEDVTYKQVNQLPADAIPVSTIGFDVIMGKERKRPFALVRIPVYVNGAEGLKQLSSLTLDVMEAAETPAATAYKTTAANSPLAIGDWYKVAVTYNGLFKVDYALLSSKTGISGNIPSAQIRVFGNGGNMLPEDNAIPRKEDLSETAIWMNDGGDGSFGPGDYFMFYAVGPTGWAFDATLGIFIHTKNLYEDKGYYFINVNGANGKRVSKQGTPPTPNAFVSSYNDYKLHEQDLFNPARYGKNWVGEDMSNKSGASLSKSFEFELGTLAGDASYRIALASRCSDAPNNFTVTRNGSTIGNYTLGRAAYNDDAVPLTYETGFVKLAGAGGKNTIGITYSPANNDGTGYLDFIEINTRRQLMFEADAFTFRDVNSVATGNTASFSIANADGATQVWDVTDKHEPVMMNGSLSGNTYTFSNGAGTLREYAASKGGNAPAPEFIGKVQNQNLHGEPQTDYIIVSNSAFLQAANELADFHRQRNNLRVLVTTPETIYNEFSSGGQDISAIRDFVKMFYDRAGADTTQMPKYLLLLGDASYDYKDRLSNNTNFVPTFESAQSFDKIGSYSGDDFFGFLDDNENIEATNIANTLDVGMGRFPVKSLDEALAMVNKIKAYKSPASLGAWRLSTTFIADNEDNAGPHMEDGEIMDGIVQSRSILYNSTKIYQDAIPFVSTPGGLRAPEANKMINDQMYKGTLLLNYSGHGNIDVLSHERIITQDDYNKWDDIYKMPIMITATCDFGQFDQPQFVSAGEQVVLKKDGGAIGSLTTTQLVYQDPNRIINRDFLDAQFGRVNGRWNTLGDALRIGKNKTYSIASTSASYIVNFRKFALLGDPALTPNFPEHYIRTENIKDGISGNAVSSISALGSYVVNGIVTDAVGSILSGFNGRMNIVIYDKPRTVKTLTGINKSFKQRNNIIYRGKATVTNGKFSVAFIAPKDINYEIGKGKISFYAENGQTDAAGADTSYNIGGYSDNPILEYNPPIVRPYIGDSLFRNGGLTGSNTLLFAILEDETGINVSGNAVGHDLVGILDDNVESPYIMNEYYETEANTYKRGYVNFPLYNIPDGRHRLRVKAWDVNNNSGEGTVDFEVANGNLVKLQKLGNYPNPFKNNTTFVFEHNHPDEYLYAEIHIYSMEGRLVRSLKQVYTAGSGASRELNWDGTDNNGVLLQSGVYLYKLSITSEKGVNDIAYQKLVITR
ncbi:hypothetical protein CAP35_01535 [Chitinophagaceae bacterium IBVUCB1]|nr:hypothetical protein CAP35_01535 [Chitinophagaceae bacterium IBVUCB1]